MSYTITKVITVTNQRLHESIDLTRPLKSYIGQNAHLVVNENNFLHMVSLDKILTFVQGLDFTKPVTTALAGLFSDQFITRFSSTGIPSMTQEGFYTNRLRVFNPTAYKDYKVSFTSVNTPQIRDDASKKGYLDDLVISGDKDLTNCLVAVNGVFHRTAMFDKELFVLDGFRNMRLKGRQDITVIDTSELGGHSVIPLTPSNTSKPDYQGQAIVTLDQSILNKTVFAVIDGYFYHLECGVLEYASDKRLKLNTSKLLLTEQFRHNPRTVYKRDYFGSDADPATRKYTDPYETIFLDQTQVSADALENADFQYSRITAYHSFLVVVDNPSLFVSSVDLGATGTPQFYSDLSSRHISGMLNYGCGLCPSYVIWRDVHGRSSVFLSSQDSDSGHTGKAINPSLIPPLYSEPDHKALEFARLIDYISA